MSTTASIAKHPIHPMLVGFPIGLLSFSFIADLFEIGTHSAIWNSVAKYSLAAGIISAVIAALPGFLDFSLSKASKPEGWP
jgi:uncharacterized membrane protein